MAGGPEQCSICLEALDGGEVALACGHRFHAACLAQMAGALGTATTRRGALTACPNCRTVSRVTVALTPVATFGVGDRVEALWGQKWYPGEVDAVVDGGHFAFISHFFSLPGLACDSTLKLKITECPNQSTCLASRRDNISKNSN